MSNDICIINVGVGSPEHRPEMPFGTQGHRTNDWCVRGSQRLKKSFLRFNQDYSFLVWNTEMPQGTHPHAKVPYHFKVRAFELAYEAGYRRILWCDSSIWAQRDPQPIFDHLEEVGWWLPPNIFYAEANRYTTGEWCGDSALAPLGITREESWTIPNIKACSLGLNLNHPTALKFLQEWSACAPAAFAGHWCNYLGRASTDPRVKGHRHDQVAAAVIAHRLGMKLDHWEWLMDWTEAWGIPQTGMLVCQREGQGTLDDWQTWKSTEVT